VSKHGLGQWLEALWYDGRLKAIWLLPFTGIYLLAITVRRFFYRSGLLTVTTFPVPVIIVGNITVGGTGKTPLIIWLARFLAKSGYRPGIISRGYGGKADQWPQWVTVHSDPCSIGDEALLIVRQSKCPMAVGPARVASAAMLLQRSDCDVILSDDGLQHYALHRDIEIAVIDATRRLGNGFCLPAGPLREPASRLQQVDLVISNGGGAGQNEFAMQIHAGHAVNLVTGEQRELHWFVTQPCHALAGIGNPQRFFNLLSANNIDCERYIFPDHYFFQARDISFADEKPVLMTEKDAVKCHDFATERHWYVAIEAVPQEEFGQRLLRLLANLSVADSEVKD